MVPVQWSALLALQGLGFDARLGVGIQGIGFGVWGGFHAHAQTSMEPNMSHSLNSLRGYMEVTIWPSPGGVIQKDTRSLDYSLYDLLSILGLQKYQPD